MVHRPTGRKLGYGALAAAASKLPVPRKEALRLKSKSQWRYIGKGHPSYDLAALCTGKAVYGMDARMDGMVYAAVMHPPVLGGKVKSYDDKAALKVKGVRQVVAIEPFKPPAAFQPLGGLAVIADNTWAAFQGRKKLDRRVGQRPQRGLQLGPVQEGAVRDGARAGQGRAQRGKRRRGVRKEQPGNRGRVLHSASGACADGTAGGGGGISRRQSDGVDLHAKPAGRAGHRSRGS